jgi:hypothetical protein
VIEGERRLPADLSQEEKGLVGLSDEMSAKEAKQLSGGLPEDEIRRNAERNEASRTERFRDHFERLAIVTLYVVWAILCLVAVARLYHLLAPPLWWRLPDEQVARLQSIVTGGVLASIAGGHVKKRLG